MNPNYASNNTSIAKHPRHLMNTTNSCVSTAGIPSTSNSGSNKGGSKSTSSSLSSLSSMFDDEEIWAEFKTELEVNQIKTGAGIQGMMSKFMADKRMKQQQQQQEEEERAAALGNNGDAGAGNSAGGGGGGNHDDYDNGGIPRQLRLPSVTRRRSSGSALILGMLGGSVADDSTTAADEAQQQTAESLWAVDGRSQMESYQDVIRGDTKSVCGDLEDESTCEDISERKNDDEGSSKSNNVFGLFRWGGSSVDAYSSGSNRSNGSSSRGSLTHQQDANSAAPVAQTTGEPKTVLPFRDWFGLGSEKSLKNKQKPKTEVDSSSGSRNNDDPKNLPVPECTKEQTRLCLHERMSASGYVSTLPEPSSGSLFEGGPSLSSFSKSIEPDVSTSRREQQSSRDSSRSGSRDGSQGSRRGRSAQDVNSIQNNGAAPPTISYSKPSSLKPSTRVDAPKGAIKINNVNTTATATSMRNNGNNSSNDEQGTMHLLSLLLSLDNTPSDIRVKSQQPPSRDGGAAALAEKKEGPPARQPNVKQDPGHHQQHDKNNPRETHREEEKAKDVATQQHQKQQAPLDLNRCADPLLNVVNRSNSQTLNRYKPRRNHAAAAARSRPECPGPISAIAVARSRSGSADQISSIATASPGTTPTFSSNSSVTKSTDGTPSLLTTESATRSTRRRHNRALMMQEGDGNNGGGRLSRVDPSPQQMSLLSTGSSVDISRRHIPTIAGAEMKSQEWAAVAMAPTRSNIKNGSPPSAVDHALSEEQKQDSDNSFKHQVAAMASTGSMLDAKRRHVLSTKERQNQGWRVGSSKNGAAPNRAVGGRGLSDRLSNDALDRQIANMASTGTMRDVKKRHIPTTGERQNQDFNWTFDNDNPSSNGGTKSAIDKRKRQMKPSGKMHGKNAITAEQIIKAQVQAVSKNAPPTPFSNGRGLVHKPQMQNNTMPDLFRRYLENKANDRTFSSSNPASSNNQDETLPLGPTPNSSMEVRGSANDRHAADELLVEWGDTVGNDEDEKSQAELVQEPRIPSQEGKDIGPPIVWAGGLAPAVDDRTITINHSEAALRRFSDITTAFDSDENSIDCEQGDEEAAPEAFRRKMRSLSIAEELEEDEDDMPGPFGLDALQ